MFQQSPVEQFIYLFIGRRGVISSVQTLNHKKICEVKASTQQYQEQIEKMKND